MADNPKFTEHEAQYELIRRASEVLEQMVTELRLRGCKDEHHPIPAALALIPQLAAMKARLAGQTGDPTEDDTPKTAPAPKKLHQLSAQTVNSMDLGDLDNQDLLLHTREDLAEAAFTFENELMAVLGDENTMPWESYSDLPEDKLIRIIQSSVENICRMQSGK